jgi:hypothetical protein
MGRENWVNNQLNRMSSKIFPELPLQSPEENRDILRPIKIWL